MSKYKFSTKAAGNWRAADKVKLAGQRRKRDEKRAAKEKFVLIVAKCVFRPNLPLSFFPSSIERHSAPWVCQDSGVGSF